MPNQPGSQYPSLMVQGVRKIYQMGDSEVQALKGVTLSVGQGELVSIIGTSGSGKSTLLQIMGCLDRPTEGTVFIDAQDVAGLSDMDIAKIRNKKLGFIFQAFNLLPQETAVKNVEVPLQYAGMSKKERRKLAVEALNSVGLGDRINHRPSELSGGQKQRVAIARAIANRPLVILADEPTGALDKKSGIEVMQILQGLHDQGHTIIMVTHDPQIAEHAQRIIKISDGAVVEERTVEAPLRAGVAIEPEPARERAVTPSRAPSAPAKRQPAAAPTGVICAQCGTNNRDASRYCRECGVPITAPEAKTREPEAKDESSTQGQRNCPGCGSANRPGARFCAYCGESFRRSPGETDKSDGSNDTK